MADRCASCGTWLMPGAEHCDNCTAPVKKAAPRTGRREATADLELDVALPEGRPVPPRPPPGLSVAEITSPGTTRAGGAGVRGGALYDLEVQRIAEYGAAPDGLFAAIPYALHVFSRRRALMREAEQARTIRKSADAAARRALVELGQALWDRKGTLDLGEVGKRIEAVRRTMGEVDTRSREQREAQAEIAQERARLDARIAEARAEIAPWRDRETRLSTRLESQKAELARIRARLERIEIEIRNLRDVAAKEGRAPDAARTSALEADAEARRAEIAVAEVPVRELLEELTTVRRDLAARTAATATLEDERRRAEEHIRRIEGTHAHVASEASRELEDALLALAEDAHVRGLDEPLAPEAAKVESALAQLEDRRRREELHKRAIDAYDKPAVKKGAAILGAAAVLVFATLVFAIVR